MIKKAFSFKKAFIFLIVFVSVFTEFIYSFNYLFILMFNFRNFYSLNFLFNLSISNKFFFKALKLIGNVFEPYANNLPKSIICCLFDEPISFAGADSTGALSLEVSMFENHYTMNKTLSIVIKNLWFIFPFSIF